MADYSALVKGFQGGSRWAQDFRANKQFETARDQALERGEYDLESTRAFRKTQNPDAAGVLGEDYAAGNTDWTGKLQDPFAFKLFDWFKKKVGGKKRKALDLGGEGGFTTSNPVGTGEEETGTPAETYALPDQEEVGEGYSDGGAIQEEMQQQAAGAGQQFATQANAAPNTTVQAGGARPMPTVTGPIDTGRYADGGEVTDEERRKMRERAAQNRSRSPGNVQNATESVRGADRTARSGRKALDVADDAVGKFTGRAAQGAGKLRAAGAGLKRLGAAGALAGTAIDTATTPTEDYRERFGLETDDPSLMGDIGVRALGAASDLGNAMTFGAAGKLYRDKQRQAQEQVPGAESAPEEALQPEQFPQMGGGGSSGASVRRTAIGGGRGADPEMVNFGDIDIDAKEVPDMKTDDWKQYRAQMIAAAQKSGNPQAVAQVNDMVTQMQQKGFLNYGQQGLALQQAGNYRAAMSAYRAAFQYFPNGNDVEFGTSKNKRTGATQIVGFGRDEQTGKIVPGSELVMDPERVGVMLENFSRPEAFRMWTKDWRDFKQDERKYEEVTKPLAQAQADYMSNNSEANILRAENAGLRAGGAGGAAGGAANMRNAERVFRDRLGMMGLQDEAQADFLASIMSQIKVQNPGVPDNTIVQVIMQAQRDGTLEQRLQRMGIGAAPAQQQQQAPRQALPMGGAGGGEEDFNNPPPGVDTQAWFSPDLQGLSYEERVAASTPAQ
jgi:hypothetical protein